MIFEKTVSVLMPVCNEALVIEGVVMEWVNQVSKLPIGSKIIIDEANSTDGTREILEDLTRQFPNLIEVRFNADRDGFRNAIRRLLGDVQTDYAFVADSDGQYFASDFEFFLERAVNGDEFVKGVKINRKDGLFRRLFSFLMNRFIVVFIGLPFLDYNSSHYLISRRLLNQISQEDFRFRFSINVELTLKAILSNKQYSVVYVKHQVRRQGVSRGNPPIKFLKFGLVTMKEIWKLKSSF